MGFNAGSLFGIFLYYIIMMFKLENCDLYELCRVKKMRKFHIIIELWTSQMRNIFIGFSAASLFGIFIYYIIIMFKTEKWVYMAL